jgi:hypothetical protein
VCRVIAALRDPSPEFAEQVASSVGDLAVGLAGLLRALSGALSKPDHGGPHDPWREAGPHDGGPHDGSQHDGGPREGRRHDSGRHDGRRHDSADAEPHDGAQAANGPVPPPRGRPGEESEIWGGSASNTMSDSPGSGEPGASRKPMAKKAVRKAVRRDTRK